MGEAVVNAGLSRRQILASAEASLKRLGTDYIDVYLAHKIDPYTPIEETLAALETLVKTARSATSASPTGRRGWRRRRAGCSAPHGATPFRAGEIYYSLVGRDAEAELIPFALDAGIGLMIWSPLAGGFLSGKYTRDDPTGGGGRLSGFDLIPDRPASRLHDRRCPEGHRTGRRCDAGVRGDRLAAGAAGRDDGARRRQPGRNSSNDNLAAADRWSLPQEALDELEKRERHAAAISAVVLAVIRDPVADSAFGYASAMSKRSWSCLNRHKPPEVSC